MLVAGCFFSGRNRRQTVEMKISEKRNKGNNRYRCLNVTTLSWPLGWITALFIFRKKRETLSSNREIILSEVIFCGVVCEFKFDIVSETNLTRGEGSNALSGKRRHETRCRWSPKKAFKSMTLKFGFWVMSWRFWRQSWVGHEQVVIGWFGVICYPWHNKLEK